MLVELTRPLDLDPHQQAQLELHSFLNVLNVLSGDLLLLHDTLGSQPFEASLEQCYLIGETFQKQPSRAGLLDGFAQLHRQFELDRSAADSALQQLLPEAQQQFDNLLSVMSVLDARYAEMRSREQAAGGWIEFDLLQLEQEFRDFLGAVEKNALGRYHIVKNLARKQPRDYLVYLEFSALEGNKLWMPAVLKDVMRDLLANARKYTEPGGTLQVGLAEGPSSITLGVKDDGRGIPSDQLEQVVEFGFRGRNVAAHETKGAGFGLTKAYWVCRQYGGRMWIESEEGQGTTVRLEIPRRPS